MKEIKNMIEDGFSISRTAKILKLSLNDVQDYIRKNNISLKKEKFNDSLIIKIISLYKLGVSAKSLGIKYGIDKRRVMKWAKEDGILRSNEQSRKLTDLNENIFDCIDTQEKAYWLGFLYADGYNNEDNMSISIGLQARDIDHLEKYVNFMGRTREDIKLRDDGKHQSCHNVIYSKHLSKKLKELGCMQAKSLILKFPDWLDEKLYFHFIRGYFDGDGCIKISKNNEWGWQIAGTSEMCDSIAKIYSQYDIKFYKSHISKTDSNTYSIESNGNLKIEKICNLMYKDSNIHLQRKYDKYQALIKRNDQVHSRKVGGE